MRIIQIVLVAIFAIDVVRSRITRKSILIDMHVCSAQPFLEHYVEAYGRCDVDVLHMKDGSLLTLEEFNKHYNADTNSLIPGVEGTWEEIGKFVRFKPSSEEERAKLKHPLVTYSLPIKRASPFECLLIQMLEPESQLSAMSSKVQLFFSPSLNTLTHTRTNTNIVSKTCRYTFPRHESHQTIRTATCWLAASFKGRR
jgi:hypothetical protein